MARLEISSCAFLFPGTGVPLCGHEAAFFQRNKIVMEPCMDEAGRFAGADFRGCLEAGVEVTDERECQLFTYAFCCGMVRVLRDYGITASMAAGYSMGIYAALYASGAISFIDGLEMIDTAYLLMKSDAEKAEYGMGVIIGLTRSEVELLSGAASSGVYVVNSNNITCHIISGIKDGIEKILKRAEASGAIKAALLPVSIPYHHPHLQNAGNLFQTFLQKKRWNTAKFPIVSSITQELLQSPDDLMAFTFHNIFSPIDWSKVVSRIMSRGERVVLECGPGLSLTQNGRFYTEYLRFVNVKNCSRRFGL